MWGEAANANGVQLGDASTLVSGKVASNIGHFNTGMAMDLSDISVHASDNPLKKLNTLFIFASDLLNSCSLLLLKKLHVCCVQVKNRPRERTYILVRLFLDW
jgi:hypothetical protein